MVAQVIHGPDSPRHLNPSATRCPSESHYFQLSADRREIGTVIDRLQEIGEARGIYLPKEQMRLRIALEEALLNALIHGNLEISSDVREAEDGTYEALIAERSVTPPYGDRWIRVWLEITSDAAQVTIEDQGRGFDVASLPDATNPELLFRAYGRGVLLMRSFMDEVYYNATGNCVTLVKRVSVPEPESVVGP